MPRLSPEILSLIFSSTNFLTPDERRKDGRSITLVCKAWLPFGKALYWSRVKLICRREDLPSSSAVGPQRAILDNPSLGRFIIDLDITVDMGCTLYIRNLAKRPDESLEVYMDRLGFSWLRSLILSCSGIRKLTLNATPEVITIWITENIGLDLIDIGIDGARFNRTSSFRMLSLLAAFPNLSTCFFHGYNESLLIEPQYPMPPDPISLPVLNITTLNFIGVSLVEDIEGWTTMLLHGISLTTLRSLSIYWDEATMSILMSRPFSNLTTFNIQGGGDNFLLFAPLLAPYLPLLTSLENLAIFNGGIQPVISGKVISSVLDAVPPSLLHIRLHLALSKTDPFLVEFWESRRCPLLEDIVFLDGDDFKLGRWFPRKLLPSRQELTCTKSPFITR